MPKVCHFFVLSMFGDGFQDWLQHLPMHQGEVDWSVVLQNLILALLEDRNQIFFSLSVLSTLSVHR